MIIRGNEFNENVHEFRGLVRMDRENCIACGCYDAETNSASSRCATADRICRNWIIKVAER